MMSQSVIPLQAPITASQDDADWQSLTLPDGEESGWLVFRARLSGQRGYPKTLLAWMTADGQQQVARLPVARSGRICELVAIPKGSCQLRWQSGVKGPQTTEPVQLHWVNPIERRWRMLRRVLPYFWRCPRQYRLRSGLSFLRLLCGLSEAYRISGLMRDHTPFEDYSSWVKQHHGITTNDIALMSRQLERYRQLPAVRFHLMDGTEEAIDHTLHSIARLCYSMTAITVVTSQPVKGDWPFSLVQQQPSQPGEWQWLLPAGCELESAALFRLAHMVRQQPDLLWIYGDHDLLDTNGKRHSPCFKPDWSPTLLLSQNYIGWCGMWLHQSEELPRSAMELYLHWLHLGQHLTSQQIAHVPALLMQIPAKSLCTGEDNLTALQHFSSLLGQDFTVSPAHHGTCRQHWPLPNYVPTVSVIIPTRNGLALLQPCIESLVTRTDYPQLEIIVVDNQSDDPATLAYLTDIPRTYGVKVLRYDRPFNYSAINNLAVSKASGELVCLLNNDTEVISCDWLSEMVSHVLRSGVGVVGAKLYYSDGTIQHGGDAVGPGGCADHFHSGLAADNPGYQRRAVCAQELSAVTAACLLTHRSLFMDLGGLDETNLPVAFNDVDYCLRVGEAGWRIVWTPFAELYHHESVSRGKDVSLEQKVRAKRELDYMRTRWKNRLEVDPYYNPNLNYDRPDFSLSRSPRVSLPWMK